MNNKRIESDWNSKDIPELIEINLLKKVKNSINLARLIALIKILTINPSSEERNRYRKINQDHDNTNILNNLLCLYPMRKTVKYNREKIWDYDVEETILFKEEPTRIESFKKNFSRISVQGKKEEIELISRAVFEITDSLEDKITNKILLRISIDEIILKLDMVSECIQDPFSENFIYLKSELTNTHTNISENQWDNFEKDIEIFVQDIWDHISQENLSLNY